MCMICSGFVDLKCDIYLVKNKWFYKSLKHNFFYNYDAEKLRMCIRIQGWKGLTHHQQYSSSNKHACSNIKHYVPYKVYKKCTQYIKASCSMPTG